MTSEMDCSFRTLLESVSQAKSQFTQFIPGQIIGDAGEAVEHFFMNFEHSYMGDLIISFICPNGQSIQVIDQGRH